MKRSAYWWTAVTPRLCALTGALRLLRPAAPLCSHWTGDSSQTVSPCGVAKLQGDIVKWKKGDRKRYLRRRSQHHHEQNCEEPTRQHFIESPSAHHRYVYDYFTFSKMSPYSSWERLYCCKVWYEIVKQQLFVPVNNFSPPACSRWTLAHFGINSTTNFWLPWLCFCFCFFKTSPLVDIYRR